MKFIIVFGIIIVFFSISFGYCSKNESPVYPKLARAITIETAKKLKNEKGLVLAGTGGQMMGDIQMMMMGFNYYHIVDLQTARGLLIYSIEKYLSAINNDHKIRPYLHEYPFTAKNVEIVIYFRNSDGSSIASGEITVASASKGEVTYYVKYSKNGTLTEIHEETYEEALKLEEK